MVWEVTFNPKLSWDDTYLQIKYIEVVPTSPLISQIIPIFPLLPEDECYSSWHQLHSALASIIDTD